MATIDLKGGGSLHYEVHGEGRPLMIVSGLGGTAAFWQPHIAELGKHRQLILHDHRGTGSSSLDPIDFSVDQMTADTAALMDHLGLDSADIVGHSTGGAIGLTMAIEQPGRVARLVMAASWAGFDPYFDLLFHTRGLTLKTFGPAEYLRQTVLIGRPPHWLRDHPEDTAPVSAEAAAQQMRSPECTLKRIAAIRAYDRRADLHRVKCPVLVAGVEDDMVTPVHLSRELAAGIPGAKLDIADWGGHFYPLIRPEVFRAQVLSFLN